MWVWLGPAPLAKPEKTTPRGPSGPPFLSVFTPHLSLSHVTPRRFYTEAAWLAQGFIHNGLERLFFQLIITIVLLK